MDADVTSTNETSKEDFLFLNRYLADISPSRPLSAEEEALLAERIVAGDQEAKVKFLAANLGFFVQEAKKYQGYGLALEDLVQEAIYGFLEAANRFDASRGVQLSTFVYERIRGSILDALRHGSLIHVPNCPNLGSFGTMGQVQRRYTGRLIERKESIRICLH